MQEFTSQFRFIVSFLVLCLIISMIGNEKMLAAYLWLVLAGMILVNWSKFEAILGRY